MLYPKGLSFAPRKITVSTCGLVPEIERLTAERFPCNLAVSLHAPNDILRSELMPVNKGNPLPELRKAIDYYAKKSGRRVTLEAALLAGKNTDKESAEKMISFAKGIDVNVNLIPWNPVAALPFTAGGRASAI